MNAGAASLSLHTTMSQSTMTRVCGFAAGFAACGRGMYAVSAGGEALQPQTATVNLTTEQDVEVWVTFPRPTRSPLVLEAVVLRTLTPRAGVVLTVTGARTFLGQKLLRPDDRRFEVPITREAEALGTPPLPSFRGYLRLGIEHILTGTDHLLFLLGLLVVCRRLRTVAQIVTCFTLAHSLTLALAVLHVVAVPSRIVEPLIAATIVAVAFENLSRPEEPQPPDGLWVGRLATALVFGLIHGLGFASALTQTGLGAAGTSIAAPLVGFNLGVELGQLAVAGLIMAALWALRRGGRFTRRVPQITSVVVGAIGLFWLVTRLR